jgi:hypothetical protein
MTETTDRTAAEPELQPLDIAFLFLDRSACGRCRQTEEALDRAVARLRPVLETLGRSPSVRKIHVTSADQALALGFEASPTVRIEGRDIQPDIALGRCADCGDLCGCADGVDCRVWKWDGERTTVMPDALFVAAALRAIRIPGADAAAPPGDGAGPDAPSESLRRFFSTDRAGDAADCCADAATGGSGVCGR